MRLFLIAVVVLISAQLASAQSALSTANTHFEMRNYQDALKAYLTACADDPKKSRNIVSNRPVL